MIDKTTLFATVEGNAAVGTEIGKWGIPKSATQAKIQVTHDGTYPSGLVVNVVYSNNGTKYNNPASGAVAISAAGFTQTFDVSCDTFMALSVSVSGGSSVPVTYTVVFTLEK